MASLETKISSTLTKIVLKSEEEKKLKFCNYISGKEDVVEEARRRELQWFNMFRPRNRDLKQVSKLNMKFCAETRKAHLVVLVVVHCSTI